MTEYLDAAVRAPDEATFWAVAMQIGMAAAPGEPIPGVTVDGIGAIAKGPVPVDEDGNPTGEPEFWPGWHANLRADLEQVPGAAAILATWHEAGQPGTSHNGETAFDYMGVEVLDGIATPARVFL
jgi:hypothetical protein